MLLIKKADVVFSSGLNVFTGETGAGKSVIFDCLGFVFGNKKRKTFLKEKEKIQYTELILPCLLSLRTLVKIMQLLKYLK